MPLKYLHLELLTKASPEYAEHCDKFESFQLIDLFKIHYSNTETRQSGGQGAWSEPIYFHGTWSCGCIGTSRAQDGTSASVLIPTNDWCKTEHCATRGILREGHRLEHVVCDIQGHFFSNYIHVAIEYAWNKHAFMGLGCEPSQQLYPLFLCKARNVQHRPSNPSYEYVNSDEDIIPCYLAIVRHWV
ncbi:hypothetical protein BGW39_010294 [Mortierella sp. 14UC]|nr:hypothetical protein BGW39_010294 [Mortierella sp. 14UC]